MKKIASIFLSVMMIFCMSVTANAEPELQEFADDEITLFYLNTEDITTTLSISNKVASCTSDVLAKSSATKIAVTQTLQKKDGNTWRTVTNWSKTYYSSYCFYANSYSSLNGGTYRVKTTAKVYNGSSYETVYSYSTQKTC